MNRKKLLTLSLLGIYASDLHKLISNIFLAIIGKQQYNYISRRIDISLALLCFIILIVYIVKNKYQLKDKINMANVSQIIIVILYTLSLIHNRDNISIYHYARFIGGNFVLFFGTQFICEDSEDVKYIFKIWIFMTLLVSLISVYFYIVGATYKSLRAKIIPGLDFRAGYTCAVSIIYLVVNAENILDRLGTIGKISYYSFIVMLLFAVTTSGSKIAFLLLGILILGYFILKLRQNYEYIKYILGFILSSSFMLFVIYKLNRGKYGVNILLIEQYMISISSRINILRQYIQYGLSSPIIGLGISASYTIGKQRTHSVISAIFVQLGLLGLLSYIVFIGNIIKTGIKLIKQKYEFHLPYLLEVSLLMIMFFAVIFAEVASDIPGNRFLWLFSALILVLKYESTNLIIKEKNGGGES